MDDLSGLVWSSTAGSAANNKQQQQQQSQQSQSQSYPLLQPQPVRPLGGSTTPSPLMQPRANNGNYTMPSTAGKSDAFDGLLSFAGPSQNNKTLDPSKLTLAEQQQRMKSSNAAATNAPANGNMYASPLNSQMGASRQPTVGYFSPPSSNVPFSTVSPGLSPQSAYQLQQQQPPASTAASPAFNRSPVSGLQQQPVAKSVDPFGALLGDLRPGGATQKQPIAAQQTLAAKSAASNAASVSKDQLLFSGLDVLATTTTAGPAAAAAAIGTNKTAASGLDGFDEFFANPAAAAQSSQAPRLAATAAPVDDDPFGLFSSAPSVKAQVPATSSAAPVAPAKSANTAAISASSLNDNADIAPAVPPKRAVPTESSQERKPVTATDIDKMVSKMVELGFEAGESRDALAANNNSVEQAIEYLFYAKQSSSNNAKQSSMATKITQMTGLKGKNAEKAEKLLSSGFSLLNKAKVMMTDSAKKVSSAIESKTAGGRFGGGNSSRRDIRNGGEYYNYEDETDGEIQQRVRIGDSSSRSSASNSRESVVVDDGIKMKQTPPVPVKKKRSQPPVHCSQQALDAVSQLKDRGNDFFKKGQYGDAEELYSQAIVQLPGTHPAAITLLNNRAAARLKTGNYKECIVDCTQVVDYCKSELEYDDVNGDLVQEHRDSIAKALLRRANAFENIEKWEEARRDYVEVIAWNPSAKGANDGLHRCTKAVKKHAEDPSAAAAPPTSSPMMMRSAAPKVSFDPFSTSSATTAGSSSKSAGSKSEVSGSALNDLSFLADPSPSTGVYSSSAVDTANSTRVAEMRQQDRLKEREDAEKLRLKDEIDARLNNWRRGKETNLRALISSIDTILWAELKADWKPVNLSELVTPQQVKIRYMKAIAKLHPDKLSAMHLTVEQKLLANGIFSSLNDAWDAFKTQNNL